MTTQLSPTRPEPYVTEGTSPPANDSARSAFAGLRCRACGATAEVGPVFVCLRCLGPLEAVYDLDAARDQLTREHFDGRPADIWRFAELLPVSAPPTAGLRFPISPLTRAPRLARELGLERLWVKDDSRNPTLSFKDRVVAVAA